MNPKWTVQRVLPNKCSLILMIDYIFAWNVFESIEFFFSICRSHNRLCKTGSCWIYLKRYKIYSKKKWKKSQTHPHRSSFDPFLLCFFSPHPTNENFTKSTTNSGTKLLGTFARHTSKSECDLNYAPMNLADMDSWDGIYLSVDAVTSQTVRRMFNLVFRCMHTYINSSPHLIHVIHSSGSFGLYNWRKIPFELKHMQLIPATK